MQRLLISSNLKNKKAAIVKKELYVQESLS